MAFEGYFPKFTLASGKSDQRKGDGFGMIVNGVSMMADCFEGSEATDRLLDWFLSKGITTIDIVVIQHWHGDHYGGGVKMVESGKIKFKTVYAIDPLTYSHGVDGSDNGRAVQEDIDNAYKAVRIFQAHGSKVLWKDHGDSIQVGDIHWDIFRKQPTEFTEYDDGHAYAFVNDGSLILHSPELKHMICSDGPCDQKDAIHYFQKKYGKKDILRLTSVTHHGGSYSKSNAEAFVDAGGIFAYESCIERDGPGTSDWTPYGSRRLIQAGATVWMQNEDMFFTAAGGMMTIRQGSKTITLDIPYQGEKVTPGWVHNAKGWWYRYDNGGWAVGWAKLPWSKGTDWFYFDADGYMCRNWIWDPDRKCWFYLDPNSGAMWHDSWLTYKGKKCWLKPSGRAAMSETLTIDGKTYVFDKNCYATEISANASMAGVTRVIDLSEHNDKSIDWAKIKAAGYAVIIRIGLRGSMKQYPDAYGKIRYDNNYKSYLDGIIKADIPYSVYFFPTSISDAEADEEAEWIRMNVAGLKLSMPVFLDSEIVDSGNGRADGLSRADRTRYLKRIIDKLKAAGIECGVYASTSWLNNKLDMSQLSGAPVWCAQYASKCQYGGDYMLWQYSSKASIPGIDGNVDISQVMDPLPTADNDAVDVAIQIAQAEVGYHEGANNSNKYGDELHAIQPSNMDKNAAWCDAFVDWVILQTCRRFGKDEETAREVLCGDFDDYTYFSVNLYKKAGRWTSEPARGYQIFFGGSGHTGIVTKVEDGKVYTIEGNKSDAVRECSYDIDYSNIIGYGMPRYDLI